MKKVIAAFGIVLLLLGCQAGPTLSPEELQEKWRAPLLISAMNAAVCTSATETAQKVQAEEIDGFTAFGELLGAGILIKAVDESLANAEPTADQIQLLAQMQADTTALQTVIGPWIQKETTSGDVLAVIGDVCADLNGTFEQVATAAKEDGLTAEAAQQLIEKAMQAMESSLEETD